MSNTFSVNPDRLTQFGIIVIDKDEDGRVSAGDEIGFENPDTASSEAATVTSADLESPQAFSRLLAGVNPKFKKVENSSPDSLGVFMTYDENALVFMGRTPKHGDFLEKIRYGYPFDRFIAYPQFREFCEGIPQRNKCVKYMLDTGVQLAYQVHTLRRELESLEMALMAGETVSDTTLEAGLMLYVNAVELIKTIETQGERFGKKEPDDRFIFTEWATNNLYPDNLIGIRENCSRMMANPPIRYLKTCTTAFDIRLLSRDDLLPEGWMYHKGPNTPERDDKVWIVPFKLPGIFSIAEQMIQKG